MFISKEKWNILTEDRERHRLSIHALQEAVEALEGALSKVLIEGGAEKEQLYHVPMTPRQVVRAKAYAS